MADELDQEPPNSERQLAEEIRALLFTKYRATSSSLRIVNGAAVVKLLFTGGKEFLVTVSDVSA